MNDKILLDVKKAVFTNKYIIYRGRKGDIIINYSNIKSTEYFKKSFINYLLIWGSNTSPGWLNIQFKEKIDNRRGIAFKIGHDDLTKLPNKILKALMLTDFYSIWD